MPSSNRSRRPRHNSARKRRRKAAASIAALKRWNKGEPNDDNVPAGEKMTGCRILHLAKLAQNIRKVSQHSAQCRGICNVVEEVRREGLASTLLAECNTCKEALYLESSTKVKGSGSKKNRYAVNVGAVLGQMATGGGHARLNETAAMLDIPGMSKSTFSSIEMQIGCALESKLAHEITQAGELEREMAIKRNNFFEGIPAVTVTVDGGWSKRTHKHSYNAKSGVAVIIGNATKKLLFLGVRNKYCSICAVAANKNTTPQQHKCFKNWNGSSRAMETDMLLEGFRAAETMHGLRYMRMTGDGDSSVLANIQANVPGWGMKVCKVE